MEWVLIVVKSPYQWKQMVNLHCSVIFRTLNFWYIITTWIITKSRYLAAILDLKQFTIIINCFHNHENIICFIKARSPALNLGLYRKWKISMSAIFDCKLQPSWTKPRVCLNCFEISIPKLPCIRIFMPLSLI